MREIPIIFSTPMVQALLQKRKTMTRRIVKPRTAEDLALMVNMNAGINLTKAKDELIRCSCPYGKVGDLLWVRESGWVDNNYVLGLNDPYLFWKADYENYSEVDKALIKHHTCFFPSIHMYKSFARIWMQIVNIKIEGVQEISENDAKAEGVLLHETGTHYLNYTDEKANVTQFIYNCDTAKQSFKTLWTILHGFRDKPFAWFKNPWVWVIEFKVLSTTGKPELFGGIRDYKFIEQ